MKEYKSYIKNKTATGTVFKQLMSGILHKKPNIFIRRLDLYNLKISIYKRKLKGLRPVPALLAALKLSDNYFFKPFFNNNNKLLGLFLLYKIC